MVSGRPSDEVVVGATSLLLKDSFKLYRMINDGIIRLIDMFFDMGKLHAMKALDVYKRATSQGEAGVRSFIHSYSLIFHPPHFYYGAASLVCLFKMNPLHPP